MSRCSFLTLPQFGRGHQQVRMALLKAIAIALLVLPAPAHAVGVDLSWRNCVGTGLEGFNQTFTCTGATNQTYNLVLQFNSPVYLPNFKVLTAHIELMNATGGPLTPFWHNEPGGCDNPPGIVLSDDITQLSGCDVAIADPWNAGFNGSGGSAYGSDFCSSGNANLIVSEVHTSSVPIAAGQVYYGFHLRFSNQKRATCAGCTDQLVARVIDVVLESNDGTPPVYLTGPDAFSDCAAINSASSSLCPFVDDIVLSYADSDGDGYGAQNAGLAGCSIPPGRVANHLDCNDTRADIHPGVLDPCDGIDNDCDGLADNDMPQGLVSWWKAEGNALDARFVANGTLMNGATFATGEVGQAFSLDGINDHVANLGTVATFSFIQNTGVFTIEGWIKLNDPNAIREQAIIANTPTTAEKGFYFTWDNSAGLRRLSLALMKGQAGIPVIAAVSPNNVITNSGWHHVAAVGNGSGITFCVDGVPSAGGTMGGMSTGNATRVANIGQCPSASPSCQFSGQIDELAVYNRALAASEILAIYDAGTGGRCALVSVDEPLPISPVLALAAPRPNPAPGSVDLELRLPTASRVRAAVHDITGRHVRFLKDGESMPAGTHTLHWDGLDSSGRRVVPGVYLVRVSAGAGVKVQRTVMID